MLFSTYILLVAKCFEGKKEEKGTAEDDGSARYGILVSYEIAMLFPIEGITAMLKVFMGRGLMKF